MKNNGRQEKGTGQKINNYKKGIEMERTKGRLVGETKALQEFEFVFDLMRWDWVKTWNWNKERCCHYEIIKILFWFWACSLIILINGRLTIVCARTKIDRF